MGAIAYIQVSTEEQIKVGSVSLLRRSAFAAIAPWRVSS